jgi:hypothetical protein
VIPASGEHDQHLYHGWYTGHWRDNRELAPTFPTEFGVQALPDLDSPVWATLNSNWPIDGDDPSWAHAGYQAMFWANPGVGPPAQFRSLAEYVAESQAYQAFYIRYTIDQWRRRKFTPLSGYIHFLFTDGWPAITWSVLDYYRLAKDGYTALAEASRPVRLCLDPAEGFTVEHAYHLVYPDGARVEVGLHLVNDDYRRGGRASVSWWLERRDGPLRWLRNTLARLRARRLSVTLPAADAGARALPPASAVVRRPGRYRLRTRVSQGGRVLDDNRLDFRVGTPRAVQRHPRRVPGLLVRRVYQQGSLRHTGDGFTFTVRNPAMPAVLQLLDALTVDGEPLDPARVELVCGGQSRRASTVSPQAPLEFPSNERLAVIVHDHPLAPGPHTIEISAQFLGFGEVVATLKDRLV